MEKFTQSLEQDGSKALYHSLLSRARGTMGSRPAIIGRPVSLPAVIPLLFFLRICGPSSALPPTHPLRTAVDWVNESGPFIGLVMAYHTEAEALRSSREFRPRPGLPWLDLYGITVQILLDLFDISGIVHYGIAGSANDSMSFGDVSIPKFVAFTGSWTWMKFGLKTQETPELIFGKYNIPSEGKNLLSGIEFKTEELYSVNKPMEEVFWLQLDSAWLQTAQQLKDLDLQQCVNGTYCLPEKPKVVFGLKASTADIFVDNAVYRNFLFKEFGVSTVDEETAAIVMTAQSPGIPVAVFRGVSDLAGGEAKWSSTSLNTLASINALKVAIEFIGAIGKQ